MHMRTWTLIYTHNAYTSTQAQHIYTHAYEYAYKHMPAYVQAPHVYAQL